MQISNTRLDRFIHKKLGIPKKSVRLLLAQKRVIVDGVIAVDISQIVHHFSCILMDGKTIQNNTPHYIMLNKPIGVVSATKDLQHKTVIDLLPYPFKSELHIAGRLDLNSSGLLLLTNDSRWSTKLCLPEASISKLYRVTLEHPISEAYISAFADGIYFPFENITTQPVTLRIINSHVAELALTEGKYHQIKRMFGRFRNPVTKLHRFAIGNIPLDTSLQPGEHRPLTPDEIHKI